MARQPRQRSRSGFYHVMVRGNGRQVIFSNDADRRAFLRMLRTCLRDNDIELVAWCLMDNHAHLLVSDRDDELTAMLAGDLVCMDGGIEAFCQEEESAYLICHEIGMDWDILGEYPLIYQDGPIMLIENLM